MMDENNFTHLDDTGGARMVDIGGKQPGSRSARAQAVVSMEPATVRRLLDMALPKGDVLAVARIAGIMAAKKTPELIPMCHQIALEHAAIDFDVDDIKGRIAVYASISLTAKTGAEMEALTAAAIAALTIYDMCKSVDRSISISHIRILEKHGGKSDIG